MALQHKVASAAIVLAVAAAGCDRLPSSAIKQIHQCDQAYQQRRYAQARTLASHVIANHPAAPDTAEAYYLRGLCHLKSEQPAPARRDFEAGLRLTDRRELQALVYAQLGNLEFEAGRYGDAVSQYRRAQPELPDHPPSDRILLRYGISLQRTGQFREAKPVLADVLMRFAHRPTGVEAKRKLAWGADHHSVQCGVYSTQGSSQAAAKKLRDVGIEAYAWRDTIDGNTRYVVRAGQHRRYDEAVQALRRIRGTVADAFIVP